MDNKDNKRGFTGLSDLTSNTGTLPQSQSQSRQTSPQPSAPQKPVFALLELTKWPTLPAPWSSADAGETRLNLGYYEGDTISGGQAEVFRDTGSTVGSKWPASGDRRPGAGARISGCGTTYQKEKLRMRPGDSFVYGYWWPGRLGVDVHMRELGMAVMRNPYIGLGI